MLNFRFIFVLGFCFLIFILVSSVFADGWLEGDYLTGKWGGHREKWKQEGFIPFANYHMTVLSNPVGGFSRGTEYAGQLVAGMEFDLDKIFNIGGLSFIVSGAWISGRSLSLRHIGNDFSVSDVFNLPLGFTITSDAFRLYQLMFKQKLIDNKAELSFGRLSIGDSFATIEILNHFTNSGFNANPGSILFNVPSFTVSPFSSWGARIKYEQSEELYFMAGLYSANPDVSDPDNNGLDFSFDGGAFFIAEVAYSHNQKYSDTGLPGVYKIGAYFDTTDIPEINNPDSVVSSNYGIYVLFEQMLYLENRTNKEGLKFFSTFTYAPKEEVNRFPVFYSGGLGYKGLLPSRGKDKTVFGLLVGFFSENLPDQDFEMIIEFSYSIHLAKWLSVQPDIQYVINPNGSNEIDDALVLGFRMETDF